MCSTGEKVYTIPSQSGSMFAARAVGLVPRTLDFLAHLPVCSLLGSDLWFRTITEKTERERANPSGEFEEMADPIRLNQILLRCSQLGDNST